LGEKKGLVRRDRQVDNRLNGLKLLQTSIFYSITVVGIAVAKVIRTKQNTETKTRQYASLLPSAFCPRMSSGLPFAISPDF
jgi:hypothetical protein